MCRNQKVIGADDGSLLLQLGAKSPIVPIGFDGQRDNVNHLQEFFYTPGEDSRASLLHAISQFARNNGARGQAFPLFG